MLPSSSWLTVLVADMDKAFHSDNSEIMGLYVLESAKDGGKLSLSSSFSLYNRLAMTQPSVLETLAAPWVLDT
jgi:hypothetical protein